MVLVVVPDVLLRRIVIRIVRAGGFRVVPAKTLAHGRLLARGSSVTVSALVADLPARDDEICGLLEGLRRWYSQVPAVLLTHEAVDRDRLGVDGLPQVQWIEKPFARNELRDALKARERC
jgi:DNA-binding response OmpR family regulator